MFDREKMIADYNTQRDRLVDLVTSLTPDDLAQPTVCEGWTVKDLVAHMATSASNVQPLMSRHDQPNAGIDVLNQRNAEGVAKRTGQSAQESLQELLGWHDKNVAYVRGLSDEELEVKGTLVTGEVIPRGQRFVNAGLHYAEHGDMIRQATGR